MSRTHPGWMSVEEFEEAVADALDRVPQEYLDGLDNVVFTVETEPSEDQLARNCQPGQDLLGLYVGVSKPRRAGGYFGVMPDTIFLFSGPILRHSINRESAIERIRIVLLHEIGHHYGISEERLHALGYGS